MFRTYLEGKFYDMQSEQLAQTGKKLLNDRQTLRCGFSKEAEAKSIIDVEKKLARLNRDNQVGNLYTQILSRETQNDGHEAYDNTPLL